MYRSNNQVFLVFAFLCTIVCSYVQCGKCESALFKGIWRTPFNKEETLHSKVNDYNETVPCQIWQVFSFHIKFEILVWRGKILDEQQQQQHLYSPSTHADKDKKITFLFVLS